MPGMDGMAGSRTHLNGMKAAVIRLRRIVAKSVLAAKFVSDPVQNLLDFRAASRQTVGKQECAAAAVLSEGMEHLHIDIITPVLGG